jgi:thioredoxin-like negative regulator of GroEL
MRLFVTAKFLYSLISGRLGAGRAVVLKVDTERFPELASRYNVRGIPNFAVFTRGSLQFQQAGLVDANTMKSWLARASEQTIPREHWSNVPLLVNSSEKMA